METLLSIDVGSDSLQSEQELTGSSERGPRGCVANNGLGIGSLVDQAKKTGACIVLEATGSFHVALVLSAQSEGVPVCVLNPAQVRAFARSLGQRSKTDKLDARMILGCAKALREEGRLRPVRPLCPRLLLLKTLLNQRELLVKTRASLAQAGIASAVIAAMDMEVRSLDRRIASICREHGDLYRRLLGIPFVGAVSASHLVALLWDPELFPNAKAVVAYVGLDIVLRESGRYKGRSKLSKRGWAALRKVLVAGLKGAGANRHGSVVARTYQELLNRSSNPLKWIGAACAVARKIVETAWALARNGTEFDPHRFNHRQPNAMIA
jgi:transposase